MRHRLFLTLATLSCVFSTLIAQSTPSRLDPALTIASAAAPSTSTGLIGELSSYALEMDSPVTTASGATFTAPKGWSLITKKGSILLEDPNHEVSLTFVEREEQDAQAAIAAAWKQINPTFARKIKIATPLPGRKGWDAAFRIDYETSTSESREVWAHARRKGDTWYLALFDGSKDGWGRRWPQANIAFSSFKAKGVFEESFSSKKAHVLNEARLSAFEAFVEASRLAAKVPGVAVAIVQGGSVVFEKGFGVLKPGEKAAVTPKTLFRIASMTKPLTTLMMATLIDERKFAWDTALTRILPGFALGSAETTKRLTIKYSVCACTGMPAQDMESTFNSAEVSAEQRLDELKTMEPTTGFGETFQYSNLLFAAGGYAAGHAFDPRKPLEPAYEEAMQRQVFGPLGMNATTFSDETAKRHSYASPHAFSATLEPELIPPFDDVLLGTDMPAGAAWSNLQDLERYVLLELSKGRTPEGRQLVSEENLLERRKPQVRINDKANYGLGLRVEEKNGVQMVSHSGGVSGYTSRMFWLPEHGVGAIILNNLGDSDSLIDAVMRKLFELLFDGRDEAREDLAFALKDQKEWNQKEMSKVDFNPDEAWLQRFVGTWSNPSLGKVIIRIEGKRAVLDAGEWTSAIGRQKEEDGTIKLRLTSPGWTWLELLPKEENGQITLVLEVPQQKYVFKLIE